MSISPGMRHRHTGKGGDGERIRYNDILDKPDIAGASVYSEALSRSSAGTQTVTVRNLDGVAFHPKKVTIVAHTIEDADTSSATFGRVNGVAVRGQSGISNRSENFYRGNDGSFIWDITTSNTNIVQLSYSKDAVTPRVITAQVTAMSSAGTVTINWSTVDIPITGHIIVEG